jgi:AraC-like DNA-binding protein
MAPAPAYLELPVHPALSERVVCTWLDPPRPNRHPVLPDACIDLVWDGSDVLVAGPDTRAWFIESDATYVGIRFRPGAAPGFLGVPAAELVDRTTPLADFWGHSSAAELAERLSEAGPAAASLLEAAVAQRYVNSQDPDPLVAGLLVELRRPGAAIEHVADSLAVSPRSLHRRTAAALGYGPKTLHRILRFRHAVRLVRSRIGLADAAFRAGYADQAHLTNDFRRMLGATPRALSKDVPIVLAANGI